MYGSCGRRGGGLGCVGNKVGVVWGIELKSEIDVTP